MVYHNPAKSSELIAHQAIITSAGKQYPLHAWLNYDTQFCITAARDYTLQWDTCHSDLWFKCITPFETATQLGWFPYTHCDHTSYYSESCNFCHLSTQLLNQRPIAWPKTKKDSSNPVCKDFNNSWTTVCPLNIQFGFHTTAARSYRHSIPWTWRYNEEGFSDPKKRSTVVAYTSCQCTRLPTTINILHTLKCKLQHSHYSLVEKRMLWSALTLAFTGFMCASKYLNLRWSDIIHTNTIAIKLHQ